MLRLVAPILLLLALSHFGLSQMIPQCTCPAVQPCKNQYANTLIPCVDSCKAHATNLGANYGVLRQCLISRQGQIESTMKCTEASLANTCAAKPGGSVPKRFPETLKIAALTEINRMLQASGVKNQLKGLLASGKRFYDCVKGCMDKKTNNCLKTLGCGLALPSDTVLVQTAKRCAIQSGFNSAGVQAICNCAAGAGIKQLQSGVCNKLIIT
ncbi:hypothetical protein L596_008829 [Steinernema carpocapsae]|uniref:Chondroitin proteoglycan 4 domain-containing protein n=1 Tax=Steinernema carpocapsae TaxID=34508 RepID=A0A4U5PDP7_STECR|nr:hypothetical protein L596_008829 [Steinernema carpocapsae]